MPQPLRGADIVMRTLERAGHSTIFTLSGNHIMSLFDAAIGTSIDLVHTRHEAAAVHAADAWGRLTGKPGIAMVTGGPGHANAAAGADDRARPGIAGRAAVRPHRNHQLGRGGFQELRQAEMAAPVSKASWTATVGRDARRRRRQGDPHRHLRPPRPGASQPAVRFARCACRRQRRRCGRSRPISPPPPVALNDAAADAILGIIAAAARPLLIAGPHLANRSGRALLARLEAAIAGADLHHGKPARLQRRDARRLQRPDPPRAT